jgi:Tol biopolymer transport system component
VAVPAQAAFPGRNGKIAAAYFDDPGGGAGPARSGIGLLSATRGPSQQRTDVTGCTDDRKPPSDCPLDYESPAFSPNGRWIAFDAGRRIGVVRTDGTGRHLLPVAGKDVASPAWSANGKRIVFDVARTTPVASSIHDLYVAAADGSGRAKRLVRDAADPSWSVDGLLAFERPSTPGRRPRIWVSDSSGAHARPVSVGTRSLRDYSRDPDFAPDGKRLVYFSLPRSRLVTVRPDGRDRRVLSAATNPAYNPAWSPDGRRLAWDWGGIYVARSDGTHARQIVKERMGPMSTFAFYTFGPSWQPLRPFRLN